MTQKHHIMHGRDHSPGGSDPFSSSGAASGDVLSADGAGGIQWAPAGGGGGVNDPWIRHAFYQSASCSTTPDAGNATGSFVMNWNTTPVHKYDGNPYPSAWITCSGGAFTLLDLYIVEFTVWLNPDFSILIPSGNDKSGILFRITAGVNGYNGGTPDSYENSGLVTTWVWAGSTGYPPQDVHRPVIRGSAIVYRSTTATTPTIQVSGQWEGINGAWLGATPSWHGYLLAKNLSPW